MSLSEEQIENLKEAAIPLMVFLKTFHPHVQVQVTSTDVIFFEGIATARLEDAE
jgi:hypothetical protein